MNRSLLALLLWLPALLVCGCKGENPRRHYEKEGGFSFVPPEGWQMQSVPATKYQMAAGPVALGVPVNLLVVEKEFPGTVDDLVRTVLRTLPPEFQVRKRETFKGDGDLQGIKLIVEIGAEPARLRNSMYIIGKGSTKYLVTGTAPAADAATFEALFDASLKTFRFEK